MVEIPDDVRSARGRIPAHRKERPMTDLEHLDLDSIEAHHPDEPGNNPFVRPLVAALRDARAVVDRLRETMALAESVFMAEARASGQYEAERDDWRRRYEALRDGVTGLHFRDARGGCASCIDPDGFSVRWPCETAAVVARVEGDES